MREEGTNRDEDDRTRDRHRGSDRLIVALGSLLSEYRSEVPCRSVRACIS